MDNHAHSYDSTTLNTNTQNTNTNNRFTVQNVQTSEQTNNNRFVDDFNPQSSGNVSASNTNSNLMTSERVTSAVSNNFSSSNLPSSPRSPSMASNQIADSGAPGGGGAAVAASSSTKFNVKPVENTQATQDHFEAPNSNAKSKLLKNESSGGGEAYSLGISRENLGSVNNFALFEDDLAARPKIGNVLLNFHNTYNPEGNNPVMDHEKAQDGGAAGGQTQESSVKLGTLMGVYLPTIQNIFGVILFIRMAWIVGLAGTWGAFLIVLLCCCTTMSTAFSMSAIATNGVVPAGGSYFMISRNLGPEFGGAVGLLFYLGTTFASAMYILGAVEILINYISQWPSTHILGQDEIADPTKEPGKSILFYNMRIYGTFLLILMSSIVFIGVKYVNKFASFFLACVIVSIATVYAGFFRFMFTSTDTEVCMSGNRLLAQNTALQYNYTTGELTCEKSYYDKFFCEAGANGTKTCAAHYDTNDLHKFKVLNGYFGNDVSYASLNWDPKHVGSETLISAAKEQNVTNKPAIADEENYDNTAWIYQSVTTFTSFVALFFPSVTGIMAGSNRSGDLADASKSIPVGTIGAICTTSFVYLTTVILLGGAVDPMLLKDKFGSSIGGGMVLSKVTWPTHYIMLFGALLSTIGAGLQSLTGAPRLLQAIAKDGVMPILKPFAKGKANGEPSWALFLTACIAEIGILIGDLDAVTPFVTIFFLSCYWGAVRFFFRNCFSRNIFSKNLDFCKNRKLLLLHLFVNVACALQTFLEEPSWRPSFKYYHISFSIVGMILCLIMCFVTGWQYTVVVFIFAGLIYKYIELKGAENEWGDGLKGLQMSTARLALLKLEQGPPHTKNWRPQVLVLAKLDENLRLRSDKILNFCQQLKAGKGFFQLASVVEGDICFGGANLKKSKKQFSKNFHFFNDPLFYA